MLTDKDIKTTPRIARTIKDFEVGQRVAWSTDDYSWPPTHHHGTGTLIEKNGAKAIEYFDPLSPGGFDYVEPERGVWLILEDAPEPEIDPIAAAYGALKHSLRRFDGHRPFDADQPSGLAAIADVVRDARDIVRALEAASVE